MTLQPGTLRDRRPAPLDGPAGPWLGRPSGPFDFERLRAYAAVKAERLALEAPIWIPGPEHWSRWPAPGELDRLDAAEELERELERELEASRLEDERLAHYDALDAEAFRNGDIPRELNRRQVAKTRKDHYCADCKADIPKGDTAEVFTLAGPDGLRSRYRCYDCQTGRVGGGDGGSGPVSLYEQQHGYFAPDGSRGR